MKDIATNVRLDEIIHHRNTTIQKIERAMRPRCVIQLGVFMDNNNTP